MRNNKGQLCCDVCKRQIEELTYEEALADLDGHGWSNHRTANQHACYDCINKYPKWGQPFEYETYFAGRIKKGHKGKVFQMMPEFDDKGNYTGKEVECWSASVSCRNNKKVKGQLKIGDFDDEEIK